MFFLLTVLSIGTIVLFIWLTWQKLDRQSRTKTASALLVCVGFVVFFFQFGHRLGLLRPTGAVVGQGIFQKGLELSEVAGGLGDWWASTVVIIIQNLTIPAALAAGCVVIGMIASLARQHDTDPVDDIIRQRRQSDTFLYFGAALLVVGIMFDYTWTRWLGFYMPSNPSGKDGAVGIREAYFSLASAWNLYKGVNYSALLASVYVPVMAIISARADNALAKRRTSEKDFDEVGFRAKRGLNLSITESARAAAAILAPFLTGAISALPNLLS
ncbi:hypothetical protein [Mesorhizobium sp. M0578]|uniref:hypothetical protein n=1 Tax=unclassified Mesorhizobium TaxID=325217 RepID=UPI00333D0518